MRNPFTRRESARYKLLQWPYGFELRRKSDSFSAFFQGDDCEQWERDLESIDALHESKVDSVFDSVCSGYDDVLLGETDNLARELGEESN